VDTQVAMYAPDAIVTIADRVTQRGSPSVLRGREEIRGWIEEIGQITDQTVVQAWDEN
jgi:hypothetical protein